MKRFMNPFLLIFFLFFFGWNFIFAQSVTEKYSQQMTQIMAGVQANPAKAKTQLDEFLSENQSAPDSTIGFAYSNISATYGIRNMTDSGILMLNKAIPLLSGNKKIYALKNMGNLYRIKGNYEKSIEYYQSAIELNNKCGNKSARAKIIGEMATVYHETFNFAKSIQLCREAIQLDQEIGVNGKTHELLMRDKMANNFISNGNYEFAEKELESLADELKNTPDQANYYNTKLLLGVVYDNTGKYIQTKNILNDVLAYYKQINNEELVSYTKATLANNERKNGDVNVGLAYIRESFNTALEKKYTRLPEYACIYLELLNKKQDYAEGEKIIDILKGSALIQNASAEMKLRYKSAIIPILKQSNNLSALIKEQDSVIQLSEEKLNSEKDKIVNEMQAKYQTDVAEKNNKILLQEKELLSKSDRNKTWLLLLSIAVSLIIILSFGIIMYKKKTAARLQQQEIEKHRQHNEYLETKAQLESKQRLLKERIIEQQKEELLFQINESAQLREKLTKMIKGSGLDNNNEIFSQLDQLKSDKKHWDHFMAKFNATFPEFTKKIAEKYPELTNADLQFCSLIRLNLNNKEIASVLNIEPTSIYKKRSRLMDKMKLSDSDSIENLLMQI
jgi:tetratricopeptide (TPR) repeat protein